MYSDLIPYSPWTELIQPPPPIPQGGTENSLQIYFSSCYTQYQNFLRLALEVTGYTSSDTPLPPPTPQGYRQYRNCSGAIYIGHKPRELLLYRYISNRTVQVYPRAQGHLLYIL